MKIISLFLILFLLCNIALADELTVPFSCYPLLLQKEFAKHKLKLELDPIKRDKKSWAYLKNEGSKYKIFTYKSITQDELNLALSIVRAVERKQNPTKNGGK